MTINDELRAIRERAEAATEGPWVPRDLSDAGFDSENDAGWWWVWQESKLPHYGGVLRTDAHESMDGAIGEASITDAEDGHQEKADATFIAHARTDLPRLLDAVEKVLAVHEMSPGTRWVGFPRADREERYCIHDNKSWPCDTLQAITTALEGK